MVVRLRWSVSNMSLICARLTHLLGETLIIIARFTFQNQTLLIAAILNNFFNKSIICCCEVDTRRPTGRIQVDPRRRPPQPPPVNPDCRRPGPPQPARPQTHARALSTSGREEQVRRANAATRRAHGA